MDWIPLAIGYFLGSIPFGLLLTRMIGIDIRQVGSGNIGTTNVLRTGNKGLAAATWLLDAGKGVAAVVIGRWLGGEMGGIVAGTAAFVGHCFPVWLKFRGGKGVATTAGVLLALSPAAFGVFAGVFVATVAISRYISLGSMLGSVAFAAALAWLPPGGFATPRFAFGVLIAGIVIVRHRESPSSSRRTAT